MENKLEFLGREGLTTLLTQVNENTTKKLDKAPNGTNDLITNENEISLNYMPKEMLSSLVYGGTISVYSTDEGEFYPTDDAALAFEIPSVNSDKVQDEGGYVIRNADFSPVTYGGTYYTDAIKEGFYFEIHGNHTFGGIQIPEDGSSIYIKRVGDHWEEVTNIDEKFLSVVTSVNGNIGKVVLTGENIRTSKNSTESIKDVLDSSLKFGGELQYLGDVPSSIDSYWNVTLRSDIMYNVSKDNPPMWYNRDNYNEELTPIQEGTFFVFTGGYDYNPNTDHYDLPVITADFAGNYITVGDYVVARGGAWQKINNTELLSTKLDKAPNGDDYLIDTFSNKINPIYLPEELTKETPLIYGGSMWYYGTDQYEFSPSEEAANAGGFDINDVGSGAMVYADFKVQLDYYGYDDEGNSVYLMYEDAIKEGFYFEIWGGDSFGGIEVPYDETIYIKRVGDHWEQTKTTETTVVVTNTVNGQNGDVVLTGEDITFGKETISGNKAYYISEYNFTWENKKCIGKFKLTNDTNRAWPVKKDPSVDESSDLLSEYIVAFEKAQAESTTLNICCEVYVADGDSYMTDEFHKMAKVTAINGDVITTEGSQEFTIYATRPADIEELSEDSNILFIAEVPSPANGIACKTFGFALGRATVAAGHYAVASGTATHALGDYATTFGRKTAAGYSALAEGGYSQAIAHYSHAEGYNTLTKGKRSHAEGSTSKAYALASHAEGNSCVTGVSADVNGKLDDQIGRYSHAEGSQSVATGVASHAEGNKTIASNTGAHSEGESTKASGVHAHAEGLSTEASGDEAHAEGKNTKATGKQSHAEGDSTVASGLNAHAEGMKSQSNAKGATGDYSHSEGGNTTASGRYSHAEGAGTTASNIATHAEGNQTTASADGAHAEGTYDNTSTKRIVASGKGAHAEGVATFATAEGAHSEGKWTNASGISSHAEGYNTVSSGAYSHAQGSGTHATAEASSASGLGTKATKQYQTVVGKYNAEAGGDRDANNKWVGASNWAPFVVGCGDSDASRYNALVVWGDGRLVAGRATTATDEACSLTTKNYVDNAYKLTKEADKFVFTAPNGTTTITYKLAQEHNVIKLTDADGTVLSSISHVIESNNDTNAVIQHAQEVAKQNKAITESCVALGQANFTGQMGYKITEVQGTHAPDAKGVDVYTSISSITIAHTAKQGSEAVLDRTVFKAGAKLWIVIDGKSYRGMTIASLGTTTSVRPSDDPIPESSTVINVLGAPRYTTELRRFASDVCMMFLPEHPTIGDIEAKVTAMAMGYGNKATGDSAFAIGNSNEALGDFSFATGNDNIASGESSNVGGAKSEATGFLSYAHGYGIKALYDYQTVVGKYNKYEDNNIPYFGDGRYGTANSWDRSKWLGFAVGGGHGDESASEQRLNLFEVWGDGKAKVYDASDKTMKELATKEYVDKICIGTTEFTPAEIQKIRKLINSIED